MEETKGKKAKAALPGTQVLILPSKQRAHPMGQASSITSV